MPSYTFMNNISCRFFLWAGPLDIYWALLRRTLVRLPLQAARNQLSKGVARQWCFLLILIAFIACKKPYEPEAIKAINDFLVVDGFINTSANGVTTIKLSRARSISDSTFDVLPEGSGNINIESSNGAFYALHQSANGVYESLPLNLSRNQTYRLNITTGNGSHYQSDLVAVKETPLIDSLSWEQKGDVTIYANTHDPLNNSRYYRWDFIETWQHTANLESLLGVNNGRIFFRDSTNFFYNCWSDAPSTNIILGTSSALNQDVISKAPVKKLVQHDIKLGVRYSILVNQYSLTQEAYQYWEIIQKNTSNIGTLFDLQPSQLHGNIHPLTNKNEPVIGFVSAGTVQQKRLFIDHDQVTNWTIERPPHVPCDLVSIPQNGFDYLIFNYPDPRYGPYYFITGGIVLSKKDCFDCTLDGGTPVKPVFWR